MKRATLAILTTLGLFGCDLFTARDAEEPDAPRSNFEAPYTVEIALENLKNAWSDKNAQNYVAFFVDSTYANKTFRFLPSAEAATRFPSLAEWNREDERTYFANVVSRLDENQTPTLELTNVELDPMGDSATVVADYALSIPGDGESVEYVGSARIKMTLDQRLYWSAYYWEDYATSGEPSWSECRGVYR